MPSPNTTLTQAAPDATPSLGRSAAAVALGFLVMGGLAVATDVALRGVGVFPAENAMTTPLLALAMAYRMGFTVAGAYVTARFAPRKPLTHAVVLGFAGTVIALTGAAAVSRQAPGLTPTWYPLGIIGATLPCAGLGGILRVRQ